MIIVWRGAGAAVFIFGILFALGVNIATSVWFHQTNYFQTHSGAQAISLWFTSVCCWFLGRYLHSRPPKVLIDKQTGAEVIQRPIHDLLFIKLEYWGLILFAVSILVLFH